MMKSITTSLLLCVAIAGCNSESQPTKENFAAAVQSSLDTRPGVCIMPPGGKLPFDMYNGQLSKYNEQKREADTLTAVGLLKTSEVPYYLTGSTKAEPGLRYTVPDESKKFVVPGRNESFPPQFCGGKRKLQAILNWTSTTSEVGARSMVTFRYTVVDVPAWVRNPALWNFFWDLKRVDQTREDSIVLVLTKHGWKDIDEARQDEL